MMTWLTRATADLIEHGWCCCKDYATADAVRRSAYHAGYLASNPTRLHDGLYEVRLVCERVSTEGAA